jgi:hypothetical protein
MNTLINKYPGKCACCGHPVAPFEGTLVRERGRLQPAHKQCAAGEQEQPDQFDMQYEDDCRDACGL